MNISARSLERAGLAERVRAALARHRLPASAICLEITERCLTEDPHGELHTLRADGVRLAIDDFGTGYSNLPRLRALPIDRVKLDRSLVEHIAEDIDARTIAHAVIGLIHGLGCEAVGEGVETNAQAEILRVIGCDVIQGYAIAAPMDEAAFVAWSQGEVRWAAAG